MGQQSVWALPQATALPLPPSLSVTQRGIIKPAPCWLHAQRCPARMLFIIPTIGFTSLRQQGLRQRVKTSHSATLGSPLVSWQAMWEEAGNAVTEATRCECPHAWRDSFIPQPCYCSVKNRGHALEVPAYSFRSGDYNPSFQEEADQGHSSGRLCSK